MMRFAGDLAGLLHAAANGTLADAPPAAFAQDFALTVVMAANGYPGTPETGGAIRRIADAEAGGVRAFHGGDRTRTRLNSSHECEARMPAFACKTHKRET